MNEKIYKKDFPNGLRIARRRTQNDKPIRGIINQLKKVEMEKSHTHQYLNKYLEKSKLIG